MNAWSYLKRQAADSPKSSIEPLYAIQVGRIDGVYYGFVHELQVRDLLKSGDFVVVRTR